MVYAGLEQGLYFFLDIGGLFLRTKPCNHLTLTVDQKLGEVPLDALSPHDALNR